MLIGYADCGTGGALDALPSSRARGSGRSSAASPATTATSSSPAASCFAELHDAEPGTFYLTDFLAKHFDALVWQGLGLDRHPALRDMYFGNYTRVVLLSQTDDPAVRRRRRARRRAARPARSSTSTSPVDQFAVGRPASACEGRH